MIHTTAVVIGAGHAGLAMSRRLTERSIDHVVLERGEVENSGDRRVHPAGHPGRRRRRPPSTDGVTQFSGALANGLPAR